MAPPSHTHRPRSIGWVLREKKGAAELRREIEIPVLALLAAVGAARARIRDDGVGISYNAPFDSLINHLITDSRFVYSSAPVQSTGSGEVAFGSSTTKEAAKVF